MQNDKCPKCGNEVAADAACPDCTHVNGNEAAKPLWVKPPPPPEAAGWIIEPVPPELAEEFRRTFDEAAFLADLEEAMKTGGVRIEDMIEEIERICHAKD